MSRTFHLCCDQCRVHVWFGEEVGEHGPSRDPKLMIYNEPRNAAEAFLYEHMSHPLRCLPDDELDQMDDEHWVELDLEIGMPMPREDKEEA
ncbi:hypothetical protein M0638_25290 [Roseomonas sp. NAR14]|uniref:Uncharacterized protein n=1 Tax=Roseomonas acroporae TaxID=2937791 RepID=A0A9X1YCL5_9PROT|nr:hypothetical protein [Roseomonas acroporae]MCK8787686.1 hypothetical protein [Roseomonas acroporae]